MYQLGLLLLLAQLTQPVMWAAGTHAWFLRQEYALLPWAQVTVRRGQHLMSDAYAGGLRRCPALRVLAPLTACHVSCAGLAGLGSHLRARLNVTFINAQGLR